ncbi:MAG: hypothetical protein AAGG01_21125, partial [Planctomycetota bacterium]
AARTPAFLPGRRPYRRPDVSFSWRKVVRNEKNGVLALLILLCLLGLAADAAEGELSLTEERASIAAAALGLVAYGVAKSLCRWTGFLSEPGR